MRKLSIVICLFAAVLSSCNNYLDVNKNPNSPTAVTPELILPQALTATALVLNNYNTYGMQLGGYAANAGGYGGFNENVSYAFTPNNYSGLWAVTYDNLEDYQYVINQTAGVDADIYFNAAAKIMRVYDFQLLVDTYNNVPYTDALKGVGMLTPTYDKAEDIYVSLAKELDDAIAAIKTGQGAAVAPDAISNYDVLFGGDMDSWIQLANTIKLRLMVRANGKVTFSNTNFDPLGFLTTDALINPGYTRDNNKQNPAWNTWAFSYNGSDGNKAWLPSTFIMAFYNGVKLKDPDRGAKMYYEFPSTGTNQLGFESTGIPKSPSGSFWYPGTERKGTVAGGATGALKGPDAAFPLLTAAESYFLQAEGVLDNILTGDAKSLFEAGITASFEYVYMLPNGSFSGNPDADAVSYIANNSTSRLVNFNLATTTEQKREAIVTQKYIALNMVDSHEGWNEYRRTGYPVVSGDAPTSTFASTVSQSSRPDKLPSRILYPASEIQYNPENVETADSFNSLIFWAK
ncbi:SusD/RagB family nutrient-binding outer membrane lipoprotein [Cytophagaceae bacterium DM2B3-1]|uniref:SusD/RagB family nutrient-binding outer membrane lipoprotein n=1 Tax=Xanthocytophaga flava TaxID=3048013 RepID=A0ABT7CYT7_9BACT|nr:SusD/RagB family nutrient-binding outer membrane lipoprotein [Xanthocytophaga flavus]MDJ1498067.1 SusD/RagB family nutrient-binding outer membrane lipoprotein [Xanthocytophaga flavus]